MKTIAKSWRRIATQNPLRGLVRWFVLIAFPIALCVCGESHAATATWIVGNGNFTNPVNWSTGIVPGPTVDALFTNTANYTVTWTANATNSSAFVNTPGAGTTTLAVGSQTWQLTNTLIVGQTVADTGAVAHITGTIVLTNAAGTGTLVVGQAGKGSYSINGGTLIVDQLFSTNVTASATNSVFSFPKGTLTTLNGSSIIGASTASVAGDFRVGENSGVLATWNILGGTNLVVARDVLLGFNSGDRGIVTVSGAGTLWTNVTSGAFKVGSSGPGNQILITNQAHVVSGISYVGFASASNVVTVTGTNSQWDVAGTLMVGRNRVGNQLIVSNGGVVNSTDGDIAGSAGASNTSVQVTDPNSRWTMTGTIFYVGHNDSSNSLTISNGGLVSSPNSYVGYAAAVNSNIVLVTDPGSRWIINGNLTFGYQGSTSSLTITNGATVSDLDVSIGVVGSAKSNSVLVTGPGSLWQNAGTVSVGSNTTTKGIGGSILVQDGGTLEARSLISGLLVGGVPSGVISNNGGIYQFTTNAPVITTNSADSIVLNNGTISFRGITNANVFGNSIGASSNQLVKMTFVGDNAFRLNGSSNAPGVAAYNFATGTPTNYAALELVNDSTLWRSTTLTIGGTGKLLASNTTATIAAALTSTGAVKVVNSHVTFASNVVISGGYISDPSTNIFSANATVTSNGFLQGGAGDLFQFQRNLAMQSTNASLFDLSAATVLFTNGAGQHMLDLTGSWAIDRGSNFPGIASIPTNFAIGTFLLSGADSLRLTGDVVNALYVGALDFGGLGNTNNLTLDINLYYDMTLAANSYLGSNTFDLAGAGMLIPYPGVAAIIPEPSALLWLVLSAGSLMLRRRST